MAPADVPLLDGPVDIRGALDLERTQAGLRPWRFVVLRGPSKDAFGVAVTGPCDGWFQFRSSVV